MWIWDTRPWEDGAYAHAAHTRFHTFADVGCLRAEVTRDDVELGGRCLGVRSSDF